MFTNPIPKITSFSSLVPPVSKYIEKNVLTLHDELHQGFSWFHIKSIVLAGLTSVHSWHLPRYIHNPQCSIITLHLHWPIRHCNFFIRSRPKDDGFRFSSYLTLQFYCVSFSGDQRWFFLWNSQIGWNLKWEKENFSRLVCTGKAYSNTENHKETTSAGWRYVTIQMTKITETLGMGGTYPHLK